MGWVGFWIGLLTGASTLGAVAVGIALRETVDIATTPHVCPGCGAWIQAGGR